MFVLRTFARVLIVISSKCTSIVVTYSSSVFYDGSMVLDIIINLICAYLLDLLSESLKGIFILRLTSRNIVTLYIFVLFLRNFYFHFDFSI